VWSRAGSTGCATWSLAADQRLPAPQGSCTPRRPRAISLSQQPGHQQAPTGGKHAPQAPLTVPRGTRWSGQGLGCLARATSSVWIAVFHVERCRLAYHATPMLAGFPRLRYGLFATVRPCTSQMPVEHLDRNALAQSVRHHFTTQRSPTLPPPSVGIGDSTHPGYNPSLFHVEHPCPGSASNEARSPLPAPQGNLANRCSRATSLSQQPGR